MAGNFIKENKKKGGPDSVPLTFVGTDGVMVKTATMDATKKYPELTGLVTVLDSSTSKSIVRGLGHKSMSTNRTEDEVCLPKIRCIVAIKSAQAGINGLCLNYGKKNGIPASPYAQVQEFGRVDEKMNAASGSNTYEIHLDFNSYVSIFIRTMKCDDAAGQR